MTQPDNLVQRLAAVECSNTNLQGTPFQGRHAGDGWFCNICHGTGRKYWQLWQDSGVGARPGSLVLRPEAEWLGILVRIRRSFGALIDDMAWVMDEFPEAALADAIYQAEGQCSR